MHLPLNRLMMGEAAGEADFAVRLVSDADPTDRNDSDNEDHVTQDTPGPEPDLLEGGSIGDGFKLPATQAEELKFSREKKEAQSATEKRAWVVSPGELV